MKLRLQLVDPTSRHLPELLRTLYGMLMILPQSESYKILGARLQACSALHAHLNFSYSSMSIESTRRSNVEKTPDKSLIGRKTAVFGERPPPQGIDDTIELVDYFVKKMYADSNGESSRKLYENLA